MCGIAGIVHLNGAPVNEQMLLGMTRTIAYRGPDEEGYFINTVNPSATLQGQVPFHSLCSDHRAALEHTPRGHVGLGHRRLSIIDLSTGQQPLCNEDGSVWIIFNGEIYNYQGIKTELEQRGHRFRTNSDTETIIHAYEEWGAEAVKHLRGMFAYAIWDERQQQLVIARDRLGKKPLYYLHDATRFIFGSEIKVILAAADVDRELDLSALSDYLSLLYIPAPKTIFRAIRKLPAGHYAVVKHDRVDVQAYWDLPFEPRHDLSETRLMEDLIGILAESTQMRMMSEVPLGAFLSGGVDSSAVVAMMARTSQQPVVTNSIAFGVSAYDESAYARVIADKFATNHHEFQVAPEAVAVVEKLAWHYDEPFADSSAVPTYYVSQIARKNVIVSLSGDGGDENFAGYHRYFFDMRENLARNRLPQVLQQPIFGFLTQLYPRDNRWPQIFRGKAFVANLARDPAEAYFFTVSTFYGAEKEAVLHPDVRAKLKDYRTADLFHKIYRAAPAPDHLARIQYLDIKTYLCDDILTKVDRASMAVSLEVRCPILDHVFMEYAARIPSTLKLVGREGKYLLKKALEPYLPREILYRPKMGFGMPILEWLKTDLHVYARALVLDGPATQRYLNRAEVETIWQAHQTGASNASSKLWGIMMLNLWQERFGSQA